MMRKKTARWVTAAVLGLAAGTAFAQIKIAYIDPLSGLMAATGEHGLKEFQFAAEQINARGGILGKKLEVIGMDNKLSPQESLQLLNRAIDEGVHYITQGNGSSVAGALIEAVNKHNARNPDKAVLFLNYAAVDPDFTNSKCSFWHFRFDANSDMKMEAITNYIAKQQPNVKKVYLINQDYSFGHQVAKAARSMLNKKRPDIQIVGDELHPLARVKDFSPYVTKIKSSGADTVITGNWGSDLALLVKAAKDAGLNTDFYTYYAGVVGTPTALGDSGIEKVKVVSYYAANSAPPKTQKYIDAYKKKYGANEDPYTQAAHNALEMLAKAMTQSKSTEPVKVAKALEGMRYDGPFGEVYMREQDHQLIQPLFIGTFSKVDGTRVKYPADGTTAYGFRDDVKLDGSQTSQPTNCQMQRP